MSKEQLEDKGLEEYRRAIKDKEEKNWVVKNDILYRKRITKRGFAGGGTREIQEDSHRE